MKYLGCLIIFTFFTACEKAINIQPLSQKPLLVVDGTIEEGEPPFIVLSTSLNYFSEIDPEVLMASNVKDAKVTLSDGVSNIQLKEYRQHLGGNYYLSYYSSDTSIENAIIGQQGKTYTLQIEHNNEKYSSVTTIPAAAKTADSVWWKPAPFNDDTTKVVVMATLTDPAGYGNYIRYFTKVNSGPFLPGALSVFDDQFTDGTTYDYPIDQGINRNNPPEGDDYGFFRRGDTITAKLANIDKATFDFWRTLEFSYQSVGNPFSTPVKVLSNVDNGALGAFCGYSVQYKKIIIPK